MEAHPDTLQCTAADIMSRQPLSIAQDAMFSEPEALMERHTVTALVAMDQQGRPVGIVKIFDLQG